MAIQTCGGDAGAVSTGELMQTEHDTLYQFARDTGIGRTQDEFLQACALDGFCSNGGGNEHDVLIRPSGQRVLKITQPGNGYGARSRLTDYPEDFPSPRTGDERFIKEILDSENTKEYLQSIGY